MQSIVTKLATLALSFLVSGTMVVSAVGPATASAQHGVASTPRFMA